MTDLEMIDRARAWEPNGRPLTLHFAVTVWTWQTPTNAALAVESVFLNDLKRLGLYWLGTNFKRIDDPMRRQVQKSLFSEVDAE